MAEFTKGPYYTVEGSDYLKESELGNYAIREAKDGFVIAQTIGDISSLAEQEKANAHLFAAVPDLYNRHEIDFVDLEFLRLAIESNDPKKELLLRISDMVFYKEAVLKKAKGE